MAAKLRRDVAANIAKIDVEAIADHWLARFWGYKRQERKTVL
jgi:hypothetical protein